MRVISRLAVLKAKELETLPQLALGLEDMDDAYRSLPNHAKHLPYCVVSVYHTKYASVRFVVFMALLFGQASAVPNFNRVP
eukprot:841637-Karenia_brevis.AAC.1